MKTNETLAQKLCLLDLVSLLSYTAALLAALCFLVLLPGCSLGEKVDREPVQTLECTRPASLSGLYPAGGMSLLAFDNDKMGYSAMCGSGDTFWFADASLFLDAGGALYAVGDAEELIGVGTGRTTLYNVGESITACDLTANGIAGEMYDCCVLPEAGLLVGGIYENGAFRLYVIDPAQLTFEPVASAVSVPSPLTVNETLLQAYWGALNGLPVAESLQEARQQADVLEQRYGVRILLSSQCREAAALSSYPITLSDTMDTEAELNGVRAVLAAMDRSFALYPEGFLAQFRNRAGEGGLCFLLVAHIDSDYGVVGCTYDSADWQYIALDVQADYMREGTVCHEIWHATENEILSRDYTAFNWDDWNALNPAGFTYWNDSGDYDRYDARWTMFDNGEGVYFVDSYAKLAAQEDRARIMEYFMVHEDEAGLLVQSDAIRQKLTWMCRTVRECFDTAGWGTPRWEKLL